MHRRDRWAAINHGKPGKRVGGCLQDIVEGQMVSEIAARYDSFFDASGDYLVAVFLHSFFLSPCLLLHTTADSHAKTSRLSRQGC